MPSMVVPLHSPALSLVSAAAIVVANLLPLLVWMNKADDKNNIEDGLEIRWLLNNADADDTNADDGEYDEAVRRAVVAIGSKRMSMVVPEQIIIALVNKLFS